MESDREPDDYLDQLTSIHADLAGIPLDRALFHAAWEGDVAETGLLLAAKADARTIYEDNNTALHLTAFNGHTACAQLLLEARAKVKNKNVHGNNPLHLAVQNGHTACAQVLLEARAYPRTQNKDGHDALHLAVMNGYTACAHLLLHAQDTGNKADIDAKTKQGWTALQLSAYENHSAQSYCWTTRARQR